MKRTQKEAPRHTTLPTMLSGSVGVPVFACRVPHRPNILFPEVTSNPETILSPYEKKLVVESCHNQQPLEYVAIVPSKNPDAQEITRENLCEVGVLARLTGIECKADGDYQMGVTALERVKITWVDADSSALMATLTPLPEIKDLDLNSEDTIAKIEAIAMVVKEFEAKVFPPVAVSNWVARQVLIRNGRLGALLDLFAIFAGFDSNWEKDLFPYRYAALRAASLNERLEAVCNLASIIRERSKRALETIESRQKAQADAQHKSVLRAQIERLQEELGGDSENEEIAVWKARVKELKALTPALPASVIKEVEKQIHKIERYKPDDMSYGKYAEWLENFFSLGLDKRTEDNFDLANGRKILDEDHFGLTSAKDRIVEHMAVLAKQEEYLKLVKAGKANLQDEHKRRTVLCFAGPPGVAKTSLGKSIARAMGRKFCATSFGGVEDVADIHGHRETYVGAMPGRIIQGLIEAGVKNPVFMIDEIDKLVQRPGSNPEAAFLEVLDSTLSDGFVDKYMRVPVDLSEVLFILTANDLSKISQPLLDRMEVIEFSGYTAGQKREIAARHLVPKAIAFHHLPASTRFSNEALEAIRDGWVAREAGVRELDRVISKVCRKLLVTPLPENTPIEPAMLPKLLGPRAPRVSQKMSAPGVGAVNGLAYSEAGGSVLAVVIDQDIAEAKFTKLEDQIFATGSAKEVMKESLLVALARVRKLAKEKPEEFGIKLEELEKSRFHVHLAPMGVEKDGPSATVTIFTALVSALSGRLVDHTVAMTGELDLRGKVLPVGGLAQKFSAAHREKVKTILYPSSLEETVGQLKLENPELNDMTFIPINTDVEALKHAFVPNGRRSVKSRSRQKG